MQGSLRPSSPVPLGRLDLALAWFQVPLLPGDQVPCANWESRRLVGLVPKLDGTPGNPVTKACRRLGLDGPLVPCRLLRLGTQPTSRSRQPVTKACCRLVPHDPLVPCRLLRLGTQPTSRSRQPVTKACCRLVPHDPLVPCRLLRLGTQPTSRSRQPVTKHVVALFPMIPWCLAGFCGLVPSQLDPLISR